MLEEIVQPDIARIQHLFAPLDDHPFCSGVLAGKYPGRIWVDDSRTPGSAFLLTRESWGFLAGIGDNPDFNAALNRLLYTGDAVSSSTRMLMLTGTTEFQQGAIEEICLPIQPIPMPRLYYTIEQPINVNGSADPEGFEIVKIDRGMADRYSNLPGDVEKMIASWGEENNLDSLGIGFAALKEDQVVSHAVIDAVVDEAGEIGLETVPQYQRLGLAAAVGAAAINYGLANGLEKIIWDCYEHILVS